MHTKVNEGRPILVRFAIMSIAPQLHGLLKLTPLLLLLLSPSSPAVASTTITHLPGFHGPLPFSLETGYVNVDEVNGSEFFYYFIESERNPKEDPVILWLSGGPRCSAFTGLVFEIGPLQFVAAEYNGSLPNLVYRPNSWTKISNIIFQDSPAGSGFSFSRRPEGYSVGDVSWPKQAYTFLIKWFKEHPWFLTNPLYIAGDSYAGKIVPVIAQQIADDVEAGIEPILNLKGYIIGNPVTGDKVDLNARVPMAHGFGIISDQFFKFTQRSCEGEDHRYPSTEQCRTCIDIFSKFISEIQIDHVLEPKCPLDDSIGPENLDRGRRMLLDHDHLRLFHPPKFPSLACTDYVYFLAYYWANSNVTREALQVKKGTVEEWLRCRIGKLPYAMDIDSNLKYHVNLTTRGYRALVYSGDHDMRVPFLGTQEWTRSLNFAILDDWRSWHVDGQVAGYAITYSNHLTFATIKGAGHTAPQDKPKECLAMFRRWISYESL